MTPSLIWSYYLLILLFNGCIGPKMYTPTDSHRIHNKRRDVLKGIAENDPCSKRMWVFMKENSRENARRRCEKAFNIFVALPPANQDACLNAASPDCRPLPRCEHLMFGCTFKCDSTTVTWETDESTGTTKQFFIPKQEEKHLKDIVDEFSEEVEVRRKAHTKKRDDSGNRSSKGNLVFSGSSKSLTLQ